MDAPAVGGWRVARYPAEYPVELRQRLESGVKGSLADALIRIEHEILDLLDPNTGEIRRERHACRLLEGLAEMKRAHVHRTSNVGERNRI